MRHQFARAFSLFVCAVAFAVFVSLAALAQTVTPQPHKVYFLSPTQGLIPLSLETGMTKGKSKLGGLAGSKVLTKLSGERSAARLAPEAHPVFVLEIQGQLPESVPPGLYAVLVKLDVKGKTRQFVALDVTTYGVVAKSKGGALDPRGIPLNFVRHDAQSIRIEPRSSLPPEEYAFFATDPSDPYAPTNQSSYYCFGVD